MDNSASDTIWGFLSDAAVAGIVALGGIVAWLWRKVAQVDSMSQRVDALTASIAGITVKQRDIERQQGDQGLMLMEMKTDIRWTREAVEEIKHRLEK